jgi:FAD/FMN-containing dehydrogenase
MSGSVSTGVDPAALQQLRARLRGPLLLPDDAGFESSRTVWNAMIDRRPAAVARCLGVADIVASLLWAREHSVPLTIRGGGHNIAGLAVADGSLMLDMSLRRGVWVDPQSRIGYAQNGCLLGDVDRETQLHGLAAVLGFVSETGITGLTLGGGFGYLTRQYGWTTDNVRSMDMVTADGRPVRASATENADLFWGLCGGGGNFGVVTGIEYSLYPVGPEIVGGAIAWKADQTARLLELYRELVASAPPELVYVLGMRIAPPAPWIAKEAHGKPIVALFVCHGGRPEDGEAQVARVKAFGSPVGDVVQRRPYVSQQSLLDATQPKGRRYYWKSEYVPNVSAELLDVLAGHATRLVSPHSAILVFPLDGALNSLPEDHSAVGNRKTGAVVNVSASWERPEDDTANVDWARTAWRDLRRFSTGGTYINFLNEEEGEDRIHDAYGSNYGRLVEIKTRWDPQNVFRTNKNIAPRP